MPPQTLQNKTYRETLRAHTQQWSQTISQTENTTKSSMNRLLKSTRLNKHYHEAHAEHSHNSELANLPSSEHTTTKSIHCPNQHQHVHYATYMNTQRNICSLAQTSQHILLQGICGLILWASQRCWSSGGMRLAASRGWGTGMPAVADIRVTNNNNLIFLVFLQDLSL